MGDNESAVGETAKENNIKNTVNNDNVKTGTTKDNSIENPVESDNTAAGTTQGNSAKSIMDNKGAETADGDAPHIGIKDKNSKQGAPETDTQEVIKVQYSSNRRKNIENSRVDGSSVELDKGREDKLNKSIENKETRQGEKDDKEGVFIEQVNKAESVAGETVKPPQGITKKFIPNKGIWIPVGKKRNQWLKENGYVIGEDMFHGRGWGNRMSFNVIDKNGNIIGRLDRNYRVDGKVVPDHVHLNVDGENIHHWFND